MQAVNQVCQQANGGEVLRRVVVVVDLDVELLLTDNTQLDESYRIQSNHGSQSIVQTNLFLGDFDEQIVHNDFSQRHDQVLSHIRILSFKISHVLFKTENK